MVTPEELKCSTYRIEEVKAPEGFVRQGYEMSLYEGQTVISPLEVTEKAVTKKNAKEGIVITVSSDTPIRLIRIPSSHCGNRAANDESRWKPDINKTGEQPVEVKEIPCLQRQKDWLERSKMQ